MAALVNPSVSRELILASPIAHPAVDRHHDDLDAHHVRDLTALQGRPLEDQHDGLSARKGAAYCTVAPEISTSRRHLTSSLSMKALNSAGVLPTGSLPCSASFAFTSGERSASIVALVDPVDDLRRRLRRRHQPVPERDLVARQRSPAIVGNFRQQRRSLRRGDAERLELVGPHLLHHLDQRCEDDLHLPAEQIADRRARRRDRRCAVIRTPASELNSSPDEMLRGAVAGRRRNSACPDWPSDRR